MSDYYEVLGVHKGVNADELRKAYRRKARAMHPDVNPDPATHEKFKEVTQAYDVLSDPQKRQAYDFTRTELFRNQQTTTTSRDGRTAPTDPNDILHDLLRNQWKWNPVECSVCGNRFVHKPGTPRKCENCSRNEREDYMDPQYAYEPEDEDAGYDIFEGNDWQ